MLTRRTFLQALAALAVAPGCAREGTAPPPPGVGSPTGVLLNDVHSELNPTWVERVVPIPSLTALRAAIRDARAEERAISVAGGRHAMGGQQLGADTVHLDTRPLRRVLGFDQARGRITVEAGIEWPELIAWYTARQRPEPGGWSIAQKQTGADRLTLGGSLSANAHGRGLTMRPIIGDVEEIVLVDARGRVRRCNRQRSADLFQLAIGGYGLFGVIYSVTLRLRRREKLERLVEVREADGLVRAFEQRIREGHIYGDFQLETDEGSPGFLRRGVFACYRPVPDDTPVRADQVELSPEEWMRLFHLAHADKRKVFDLYAEHYLATSGQTYWTDTSQLSYYPQGYHREVEKRLGTGQRGSEMITEVYVPRDRLDDFLHSAAAGLRALRADVIYGTVRLIERDAESFLAWARESWACIVVNLHVDHTPAGVAGAEETFRLLIDLAQVRGGTYFLTYHRWATRAQVLACHPQMPDFFARKRAFDAEDRFQSEWYRHHRTLIG